MQEGGHASGARWYVTNGEDVVGPIDADVLVRAVATGRVGESCLVCQPTWPSWRPIGEVREVHALMRTRAARGDDWVPTERWSPGGTSAAAVARASLWIEDAGDEDEVIALALQAMVLETRATTGVAHRPRRALGPLEIRAVFGVGAEAHLGREVASDDAAIRIARRGTAVLGDLDAAPDALAAAASRTADGRVRGLAVAPIYFGGRLSAVLELAKTERPFRRGDRAWMRAVTHAAAARMAA